jgi:hypothetical protein
MGNTTDKIKEGIRDTAGAVKQGTEKVKDAGGVFTRGGVGQEWMPVGASLPDNSRFVLVEERCAPSPETWRAWSG